MNTEDQIIELLGVMDIFQDKFKTITSNGHFSGSFFQKV